MSDNWILQKCLLCVVVGVGLRFYGDYGISFFPSSFLFVLSATLTAHKCNWHILTSEPHFKMHVQNWGVLLKNGAQNYLFLMISSNYLQNRT